MSLHKITNLEDLHQHLYAAMQLEHATIPVYLTALYSIRPGTNVDAYHIIRAVAVEEMLHLTLVGNLFNAVGGNPDLTRPDFVPRFPAYLPDGETDFQVPLQGFSRAAIETFLRIERPASLQAEGARTVHASRKAAPAHGDRHRLRAGHVQRDAAEHFYSIGEFYKAIEQGLDDLHAQMGEKLFSGDPARQITSGYYYSGGGELTAITDMASAKKALDLIAEQGEGVTDAIFDSEGEIAHYYRFHQILLGRYYVDGDVQNHPTGAPLAVDWGAAYPIRTNATLADYPAGSELRVGAEAFNRAYADFLGLLTRALQGRPELFVEAVGSMFRIKDLCYGLMRQSIPGMPGVNAAPTFEMPG